MNCIDCGSALKTGQGYHGEVCNSCRAESALRANGRLPSAEEIAAASAEIQATWTDYERCKRSGVKEQPVETPVVAFGR